MTFRVVPQELRALASTLSGDAGAAQAACSYAHAATELKDAGWAVPALPRRHEQAVSAIAESLEHIVSVLAGSAHELRASADSYQHTDLHNAARLDATYPSH